MKTAIIGLGNIGSRVARNLATGHVPLIVADRSLDKAQKLAAELGSVATAMPLANALESADVVVLAVYLDAIKDLLVQYRVDLIGKILVDPSNPIGPDGKGGFKKTIPENQSSGELLAALVPEGTELVKAFGTVAAESLEAGANRKPDPAVLFYATDYAEAGRVVAHLIEASGFAPFSIGGIDQSRRIEVFGDLHEMGTLGKLVTVAEAEAVLKS